MGEVRSGRSSRPPALDGVAELGMGSGRLLKANSFPSWLTAANGRYEVTFIAVCNAIPAPDSAATALRPPLRIGGADLDMPSPSAPDPERISAADSTRPHTPDVSAANEVVGLWWGVLISAGFRAGVGFDRSPDRGQRQYGHQTDAGSHRPMFS